MSIEKELEALERFRRRFHYMKEELEPFSVELSEEEREAIAVEDLARQEPRLAYAFEVICQGLDADGYYPKSLIFDTVWLILARLLLVVGKTDKHITSMEG